MSRDSFDSCMVCGERFTPAHRRLKHYLVDLPSHAGVYEIFYRSSYYVGISINLRRRLREHCRGLNSGKRINRGLVAFMREVGGMAKLNVRIIWTSPRAASKLLRQLETAHIGHRRRQHRRVFNSVYDTTKGLFPKAIRTSAALKAAATKRKTGADRLAAQKAARTRAAQRIAANGVRV